MPFVTVRDINVYYEIAGVGPKLLYINGTGGDLRRRPNVFDSPLTQHFTVLSYDQRAGADGHSRNPVRWRIMPRMPMHCSMPWAGKAAW